jgi:WD repeat-containing protein 59
MSGRTSIEHVLNAHYRAITDINWHPTDPEIVASTGLDSWVWIWDMRTLSKPALGKLADLCMLLPGSPFTGRPLRFSM